MAQEFPNVIQACGSVNGTTGAKVSGAGAVPAQTGKGVYTLTLDQPVDSTQCSCHVTARGSGFGSPSVEQTSDSVKTVHIFDAAGAAANADFDFQILRMPDGVL